MEKIWLNSYPLGVPETINTDTFPSIVEAFTKYTKDYADYCAFSSFGTELSYKDLSQYSLHLAAYLQHLGLQPGDRVAVMLPNLLQYPVTLFAVLCSGMVIVNLNPLYTAYEVGRILLDSGAKAIVVLANYAHVIAEIIDQTHLQHVIVTEIGDLLGGVKGRVINWTVKHIKHLVPAYSLKKVHSFKEALQQGRKLWYVKPQINSDDLAFLQYTAGTTDSPKGVMLSHGNILANVSQCLAWMRQGLLQGAEISLGALPFYHIFALVVCCFCFLAYGGHCLLVTDPRDIKGLIKLLIKQPVTVFIGINTLLVHLMRHPDFSKIDWTALKLTVVGGMATEKKVAEAWKTATGILLSEGYGLTEASPVVSMNLLDRKFFNETIGLPLPATDIDIRNEQGVSMKINEVGELWVKGPQVMQGYWQNQAATAQVLDKAGWLATGDLVRMDELGFLYLVDRKKDIVIISGFNVYPGEVERVMSNCPGIVEVAVVGVPDPDTGEALKAFVVRDNPALTRKQIIAYCRQYLTNYKLPHKIAFCTSLPKSSVGKVLRRQLKGKKQ